jgi:hypothetical protein
MSNLPSGWEIQRGQALAGGFNVVAPSGAWSRVNHSDTVLCELMEYLLSAVPALPPENQEQSLVHLAGGKLDSTAPSLERELALAQVGEFAGQVGQAHLAALVDELRPDAERFRFLVNQDIENDFPRSGLFIGQIPDNCALTGSEAIAAIDAALQSGSDSPKTLPAKCKKEGLGAQEGPTDLVQDLLELVDLTAWQQVVVNRAAERIAALSAHMSTPSTDAADVSIKQGNVDVSAHVAPVRGGKP